MQVFIRLHYNNRSYMNARGEAVIYDIFRKYILFVAATGFDYISFITRYFFR